MQSLITFSHFSILSHSSALSIVGLPSFLKCFLLLALILSDLVFFSNLSIFGFCCFFPQVEFFHCLPSLVLFSTLLQWGHPNLLSTSLWIRLQIFRSLTYLISSCPTFLTPNFTFCWHKFITDFHILLLVFHFSLYPLQTPKGNSSIGT